MERLIIRAAFLGSAPWKKITTQGAWCSLDPVVKLKLFYFDPGGLSIKKFVQIEQLRKKIFYILF